MGTRAWLNWRAFDPDVEAIEDADEESHSDRQLSGGPKTFGPYRLDTVIRGGRSWQAQSGETRRVRNEIRRVSAAPSPGSAFDFVEARAHTNPSALCIDQGFVRA
jgi:hypothetical protein